MLLRICVDAKKLLARPPCWIELAYEACFIDIRRLYVEYVCLCEIARYEGQAEDQW